MARSIGTRIGRAAGAAPPTAAALSRLSGVRLPVGTDPNAGGGGGLGGGGGTITHGRQLTSANTGPEAGGYTLTEWTGSYLLSTSGQTITGKRFTDVGPQVTGNNVTFQGCEFQQTDPNMFVVRVDGQGTKFVNCRWRPRSTSTAPVSFAQSYQQGIKMIDGVGLTVQKSEFWGFGNAIEFGGGNSTQALPILVEDTYMHDAADQANAVYHHDGILSSDGVSWVTVRRCRITSGGNTNAIAFQTPAGGTRWTNLLLTANQFGGFGYTVNLGDDIPSNTVTFTGNEFTTTPAANFGPFKNNWAAFTGTNIWSGNVWSTGGYWWPTDGNTTGGHASDFTP